MNMKKILCKYCSEENKNERVTIGSIIDFIMGKVLQIFAILMILFVLFIATLFAVNMHAKTWKEAFVSVFTTWVLIGTVVIFTGGIIYLYLKSHEIEIAKCERK